MKLPMKNQLKDLTKQHPELALKKPESRHTEHLSDGEWKELMGQFDQRLNRRNGALRRGR